MDKRPWFLSWLAPVSWLVVVVLLGVYVGTPALHLGTPALHLEAPTLAWLVTLAVIVLALTHLGRLGHGSLPGSHPRHEPRGLRRPASNGAGGTQGRAPHAPCSYKGRRHSGGKPRFD